MWFDILQLQYRLFPSLTASTVSLFALETDRFFAASGVQLAQSNQFQSRRSAFYSQLKSKVGKMITRMIELLGLIIKPFDNPRQRAEIQSQ